MRLFNTFRKIINLTSCNLPIFTSLYYKDYIGIFVTSYRKTRSQINDMFLFQRVIITMWHYNNDIILSTNFDFEKVSDSVLKFVHVFFMVSVLKKNGIDKSICTGFENFLCRKKYWYRFRKKLVLKKYRYRKKIGIEESIGIGIKKNWYRKKVSDLVSFRFLVSSHWPSETFYADILAIF